MADDIVQETILGVSGVLLGSVLVGLYTQSIQYTVSFALIAGFPFLFVGLIGFGIKCDEWLGVEHGYGWGHLDSEDSRSKE